MCEDCGCVWKHHPAKIKTPEERRESHTCPVCGREEYWVYEGFLRAWRPSEIEAAKEKRLASV
jgi:hypothetical protein